MSSFYAIRGGRELTEDEFRAHVALAARLENVGVLLGAGASKGAGGGVMADVWADVLGTARTSAEWLIANKFLPENVLTGKVADVEGLLGAIALAEMEWKRVGSSTIELKRHCQEVLRAVLRAALLDESLWKQPEALSDTRKLDDHVRLLSRLVSNRQPGQPAPWIFTTNYDLSLEWAAELLSLHIINGFSGLHTRAFVPSNFDLGFRNAQARGEARFGTYNVYLAKMHGSLSWRVLEDGTVVERPAISQWTDVNSFLNKDEYKEWPGLLIFPSAAKFVQTVGFVYGEIIRRFTEFLSRPNVCLLVNGYGFNDDHLNRIIISALQNPTFQLIVYLPELDKLGLYPKLGAADADIRPNPLLERLIRRELPQVTVCGYGSRAFFSSMTQDLPEPALLDDPAARARDLARILTEVADAKSDPRQNVGEGGKVRAPRSSNNGSKKFSSGMDIKDLF
jgi:hypothetical protein